MTDASRPSPLVAFLRNEAFYLAIVVIVVILTTIQSVEAFRAATENATTGGPVVDDLIQLERVHRDVLSRMRLTHYDRAAFPLWVLRLRLGLTVTGLAVGLVLAGLGLVRGRRFTVQRTVHPAWTLWDCFKVAALWYAGRLLLGRIFSAYGPMPTLFPRFWVGELMGLVLLTGVLIHVVRGERGRPLSELGIHPHRLGAAVGVGLLAFLIIQPIFELIHSAQLELVQKMPLHETLQALLTTPSAATLLLGTLTAAVAAPIAEEVLFRGLLQPALQDWFGPFRGWIVCAVFFAAAHGHLFDFPSLFVLGLALGYVYSRTASLAAPITLHVACNSLSLLILMSHRYLQGQVMQLFR